MKPAIIFHGLDGWTRAVRKLLLATEKETVSALTDIVNIVEREAKTLAPVGSSPLGQKTRRRGGQMKASITHDVSKSGMLISAAVGTNVRHAVFTELGTNAIIRANHAATITAKDVVSKGKYSWPVVLDPKHPIKTWKALRGRGGSGSTMPWLRTAAVRRRAQINKRLLKIGERI